MTVPALYGGSSMLKSRFLLIFAAVLMAGCTHSAADEPSTGPGLGARPLKAPLVSYHQHLMSPGAAEASGLPPLDTRGLLAQLDAAGIRQAVVLSFAYFFADERRNLPNGEALLRAENDWTSAQVSASHGRLVGFCGVNPLTDYALAEIERCTRLPSMVGVKLHHGNSGVDLRDAEHVRKLREVFAFANRRRLPITLHLRARTTQPWGREGARIFLENVLSAAPSSLVQVAHLAGAGPGYPSGADEAMEVLAGAVEAGDPRARNLYIDVSTAATDETAPAEGLLIARRLRQFGMKRVLFGADFAARGNPAPAESWRIFREKVPLTEAEFQTIMGNIMPYLAGR